MITTRIFPAILAITITAGCAVSTGHEFDTSFASDISRGTTTQAEVRNRLGAPHAVTVDGRTETWSYSHYKGPNLGQTYGAVFGGSSLPNSSESATIVFKNGIVTDYSFRKGNGGDNALTRAYADQNK
jgi:outer membrane protein assembly factor BamE (lipoprotein component of BamABCDE complex)